jgi:hypothetical protein
MAYKVMKMGIHAPGDFVADAGRCFKVGKSCLFDPARGAKMMQERTLPGRADARYFVELALGELAAATRAMCGDRETMRLVPQALQIIKHGITRRKLKGGSSEHVKPFPPGIPVRPLRDGN